MSGIDFTTEGLINELKVRGSVPTSQNLFLPADFVTVMNSQMHSKVIPAIHRVHEDYFVKTSDVAIVSGQNYYNIPSRAVAGRLRDIVLVDSNGTEIELPLGRTEDNKSPRPLFEFYFQGHQIILIPTPTDTSLSVRFKFERRPNNLCIPSLAATITAIDTGTKIVTVSRKPSTWDEDTLFDITNPDNPFNPIADDQAITAAISGFDLPFSSIPTGLAVGQYIAEAGLTSIPQMPYEAHLVIAEFGGAVVRASLKNKAPQPEDFAEAQKQLEEFLAEINPRVDGEAKRVVNQSGGIFGASAYGSYGYRANVGP